MQLPKKSCVKYRVVGDGISMHDDAGVKFFEHFGCRKFHQEISCTFAGISIGMPVYPGNKFFRNLFTQNLVTQRIPGKCWINNTEITMASSGSCPCIQ